MKYILPVLFLVGCAGQPTLTTKIQRVEVPIAVACKTETPKPPDYCFGALSKSDSIFFKTRCLLSDRKLSLGYETELLTALKSCQ